MKTNLKDKAQNALLFVTCVTLILAFSMLLLVPFVSSAPTAPTITYVTNSTYTATLYNRSADNKGTITTINLNANQQNYKWKAYVGNVSGGLTLADAGGESIYDWSTAMVGEVYVSKHSAITWTTINCADQASITAEQLSLGISASAADNINFTFNHTVHAAFDVGTTPMSGCKSKAMNINDAYQVMSATATYQEILLRNTGTGDLIYSTIINDSATGYNGDSYDFQLIVAENESATTPATYFFWVELG